MTQAIEQIKTQARKDRVFQAELINRVARYIAAKNFTGDFGCDLQAAIEVAKTII